MRDERHGSTRHGQCGHKEGTSRRRTSSLTLTLRCLNLIIGSPWGWRTHGVWDVRHGGRTAHQRPRHTTRTRDGRGLLARESAIPTTLTTRMTRTRSPCSDPSTIEHPSGPAVRANATLFPLPLPLPLPLPRPLPRPRVRFDDFDIPRVPVPLRAGAVAGEAHPR